MSEIDHDPDESAPDRPPDSAHEPSPETDAALVRRVVMAGHGDDPGTARANLHHPDPHVRAAALGALQRLGDLEPQELSQGLADAHVVVRRRSASISARRDDMTPALLRALQDTDPTVAETAAFALGEHSPPPELADQATQSLASVTLSHQDALCREAAVAALGSLGLAAGRDAVLAACRDKATVRRRAVLALAAFDGPEVTEMLRTLAEDRDLQVRQAAEDLLAIEQGEAT